MATVSAPVPAAQAGPVRHGRARLIVCINEIIYTLRPLARPRRGWSLAVQTGPSAGSRYEVTHGRTGRHCTCPDHVERHARCKHLGALVSLGLIPAAARGGAL